MLGFKLRSRKAASPILVPVWTSGTTTASMWDEMETIRGYEQMAERYRISDLIYMCINRLASMAGMERLLLYDPESERDPVSGIPTKIIDDHPFSDLWNQPNAWDSAFEFLRDTVAYLKISGNSYWHLDDGAEPKPMDGDAKKRLFEPEGEPVALWTMRPDRVKIKKDKKKWISNYVYEIGGEKNYLPPERVRHFKDFNAKDDYEGMSPMEPANLPSQLDTAGQKSNWAFFHNAMRLSLVFASDMDRVDEDQLDLMEKYLLEKHTGGPEKAHQPYFTWAGFKPVQTSATPKDAEFVNQSKLSRMRIFGIFGIHPAIVLSEDVNLANAQVGEYVTRKFTLQPLLEQIASDITPILSLWEGEGAPPAEAHFPNVVPQNKEMEGRVADAQAGAAQKLIQALGPEEGVAEAQRKGLLSKDINPARVFPVGNAPAIMSRAKATNGHSHEEDDALLREFFRYP